MLDTTTPRGRLLAAALKLAAERPWKHVTLLEIAAEAGETLASLRAEFESKPAIVSGLIRAVDDALLASARKPEAVEGPRDALFEVIMARLDLLAPYKPALRSMMGDATPDLGALKSMLDSQGWMLSAAGIDSSGPRGAVRTLGLASLYASVVRTWLADDDPGQARTMAALDRRLRRGERNIKALEGMCDAAEGFGKRLGALFSGARPRRPSSRPTPADAMSNGDSG